MKTAMLRSRELEVSVRIPGKIPESQRFDACGVVEQVVLRDRHRFCQPEQKIPGRITSRGIGLSSEFQDRIPQEAQEGEYFPKFGVGLLRQKKDFAKHDKWSPYKDAIYFRRSWDQPDESSMVFLEKPMECRGYALRIRMHLQVLANTLTITTTVENTGSRLYQGMEYQHNFLAIDDLPAGPGYQMTIPYDGEIRNILTRGRRHARNDGFRVVKENGFPGELTQIPVTVEGQTIVWTGSMEGKTFHKVTEKNRIRTVPLYCWTLSNSITGASVTEIHHFIPERMALWGTDHCLCNEVFCPVRLQPGERTQFARTWIFEALD